MSRAHSPSEFPARSGGPPYCLLCGSDWPCAGHVMENRDARADRARAIDEANALGYREGHRAAVAAERARIKDGVEWEDVLDALDVAIHAPAEMEVNKERWRAAEAAVLRIIEGERP